MALVNITVRPSFGKILEGTKYSIPDNGYYTLVGKNSSGKSSFLQYIFFNVGSALLLLADRGIVQAGERNSSKVIEDFQNTIRNKLQNHHAPISSEFIYSDLMQFIITLPQILINSSSRKEIFSEEGKILNDLKYFGYNVDIQKLSILFGEGQLGNNETIDKQGSGLRHILPIILAVNINSYNCILIDEPENALEPILQKKLKSFLIEKAKDKVIIVSTHSHLFIDKNRQESIWKIEKGTINQNIQKEEIPGIVFNLLGSSPADILLPEAIIVTEGISDSIFLDKIILLKEYTNIGVHFADGDNKITDAVKAIEQMLKPLGGYALMFKEVTSVLFDKLSGQKEKFIVDVRAHLGVSEDSARVTELGLNGIEYYYPKDIVKDILGLEIEINDDNIEDFLTSYDTKNSIGLLMGKEISKAQLAVDVSAKLTLEHLNSERILPLIKLVEEANNCKSYRTNH